MNELWRTITLPFRGKGLGRLSIVRKIDRMTFDFILRFKGPFVVEREGIKMYILPQDPAAHPVVLRNLWWCMGWKK